MRIIIIAGANGAGKTSFAHELLPKEAECTEFVNADYIAAGLSPFHPESVAWQAGRLMMERITLLGERRVDFAFETTLSTRSYLTRIRGWQAAGVHVELHFLKLPNADWAVHRVAERVRLGGHKIPEEVIRRRFRRGWNHFTHHYRKLVDHWTLYDSSVMPPAKLDDGPESNAVGEEIPPYHRPPRKTSVPQKAVDGLPALTRAAAKAIARARAAGLEPVIRFADAENKPEPTAADRS